jgi:hypothetical protein
LGSLKEIDFIVGVKVDVFEFKYVVLEFPWEPP